MGTVLIKINRARTLVYLLWQRVPCTRACESTIAQSPSDALFSPFVAQERGLMHFLHSLKLSLRKLYKKMEDEKQKY